MTNLTSPKPLVLDTPATRAHAQYLACQAAELDAWHSGWVAGVMQATGASALPLAMWQEYFDMLIAQIVSDEVLLLNEHDLDISQMLAAYVQQTGMVIQ